MKLTTVIRDQIVKNTLAATFEERTAALRSEENELAVLAYNACYTKDQQDLMARLPDEFFSQKSIMHIGSRGFDLISSRKVSASDNWNYRKPCWNADDPTVLKRVKDYQVAADKLKADRDQLKSELKQMLAGINTDKQLRERWPDGEQFYAELLTAKPLTNPPVVQAETVNALIQACKAVRP